MTVRTKTLATAVAAAALLGAVATASAHIEVSSDTTEAGGEAMLTFSVPHGCDGAATNKLVVKVADGVTMFKPERSPFWKVDVTTRKLDTPIKGEEGNDITEVPDVATWTATTPLPDDSLDLLHVSATLPGDAAAGDQVRFPLVQECVGGAKTNWNQPVVEGQDEPEHPVPTITIGAAAAGGGDAAGGHAGMGASAEGGDHAAADADGSMKKEGSETTSSKHPDAKLASLEDDVDTARLFGIIGIALGALGVVFGLAARRRRPRD